jgi:hypothetical protein
MIGFTRSSILTVGKGPVGVFSGGWALSLLSSPPWRNLSVLIDSGRSMLSHGGRGDRGSFEPRLAVPWAVPRNKHSRAEQGAVTLQPR